MSFNERAFDRRSVLKGVGALLGGVAVSPQLVSAGTMDRYIVTGPDDPMTVRGVSSAVRDVKLRLERPAVSGDFSHAEAETEDESFYPLQWDKQTTNAAEAHDVTTGEGATIAIIDTGTDLSHPDLAPNVTPGALFRRVAGGGADDGVFTGTGVDARRPADPLTDADEVTNADGTVVGYDPSAFEVVTDRDASGDVEGHGSHVSGIAAASVGAEVSPDFTGIAGTAPDATIVPHRVFYWELEEVTFRGENGEETRDLVVTSTTTADILAAIDFAATELGVDAMNLSIGTPPLDPQLNSAGFRQAYRLVIQEAVRSGSVVVVSAGNSGTELNSGGHETLKKLCR